MKNKLLSQLYESCKKWKTLVLLGAMLLIGINQAWAGAGWINEKGVELTFSVDGVETTRELTSSSAGGNSSLGTATTGITLTKFKAFVWRDGGNICNTQMFYRVKNSGGTTVIDHWSSAIYAPYSSQDGNNQVWQKTDLNENLASGLSAGTYTFECTFKAGGANSGSGCGDTFNFNKGGSNYSYTFTIGTQTYSVTYNKNGGTGTEPNDNTDYESGDEVEIAGNTNLEKSGYVFAGWNTAANGSGTYYVPGATFSITSSTILYAVWLDENVLDGTNIMFYIQGYSGGGDGQNNLCNSSYDKASTSYKLTNEISYVNTASDLTQYDRISNNTSGKWSGNENTDIKTASGGELFKGDGSTPKTIAAKTAATTWDVDGDVLSLSTTCNSTTGVYDGRPLYVLYYLVEESNFINVTYSASTVLAIPISAASTPHASTCDISDLSEGEYTLKTILTDGIIYYIADVDEFEVAAATSFTVAYDANGGTGTMTDSNSPYSSGATVTVKTNTFERTGYSFTGWNTDSGGGGTAYSAGNTFSISANTTLYAQWSETKSIVSLVASPAGVGTFSSGGGTVTSVQAGVDTEPSVTANAVPGYLFSSWGITGGADISSTSANPTTVTGKGAGAAATLTATFISTYAYIQGRMTVYDATRTTETHTASSKGGWDESSTRIEMSYDGTNHRFYRHTYKTPAQLKAQINSSDQWFSIKTGTVHNSFASGTVKTYHPSANTDLTTAGIGQKKAAQTSTTTYNYKFNSSATDGYVILYFDEAGVWYTLEHQVTYNGNGNTGGTVPTDNTYYANGTSVTVASAPVGWAKEGYSFGGWNKANDGSGSNYTAGSGSFTISANTTLYAKWTQTITLDANTTYHGSGANTTTSSVTLNATALSTFSGTSAAAGYQVEGYYTAATGGDKVLTKTGAFASSSVEGYITGGKWTHAGATTLYAHMEPATYSVTLDRNGGSSNGSAKVTYLSNKLTNITEPSRSGYSVWAYYKESGLTNLVADAGGNLQANVTNYTDESGNWISTSGQTLYAKWGLQVPETLKIDGPLSNGPGVWSQCCTMTKKGRTFTYTIYDLAAGSYEFCFKDASCNSTALLKPNMAICDQTKNAGNITWADAGGDYHNFTITTTAKYNVTVTVEYGETTALVTVNSSSPAATLTSNWYMIGEPFNNWNTDNHDYPLNHSYRGISKVYYRVVNFNGSNQYFRPLKNNTGYGQSTGSDVEVDLETPYAISAKMDNGTAFKAHYNHQVYCVVDETNSKFWVQNAVTYYTVTVDNQGSHGTVTLKEQVYDGVGNYETNQYAEGESINVSITANTGYYIDDISFNGEPVETNYNDASYEGTLTMPDRNATLTVTYVPISYTITYNPATPSNFEYTVQPASGTYNTTVSITVTPNQDYKITSVTANKTGAAGTSVTVSHTTGTLVYTFTQPAYGVTFNVTSAAYGLTATANPTYESRTVALGYTSTLTPEGTKGTNWFVNYVCTSKPDGSACAINQSTGVATVDKDGSYTFKVQFRTAADGGGTLLAESSGQTITMKTIPDYSSLTPTTAIIGTSYMNGSGTSVSPYFVYSSHFNDAKTLTLNVSGVGSTDDVYCAVDDANEQSMTGSGTSRTATITLPSGTIGANKTTDVTVYAKVDGQTPAAAKKALLTVYYTVHADPVVTVTATYLGEEVESAIPQSATIVLSASVTNIPGESTFTYNKGDGDYSSTTSYTINEVGTTDMHAKTSYLGDWIGTKSITTYTANSVRFVILKTDMYGDNDSIVTSRLFNSDGESFTAPSVSGYTFSSWTCRGANVRVSDDDGNSWNTSSTEETVKVKATATGSALVANYDEVKRIYFDNSKAKWSGDIYVYLFSGDAWYNDYNSGNDNGPGVVPRLDGLLQACGQMTKIGESDIYYYEYTTPYAYVAFSIGDQHTYGHLYDTKGVWRTDFSSCNPCYVAPENSDQTKYDHGNNKPTYYYNNGYWRRYMPAYAPYSIYVTGSSPSRTLSGDQGKFTPENTSVDAENFVKDLLLDGGTTYWFNLPSSCGGSYGNNGEITKDNHTNFTFVSTSGGTVGNCRITTTAGGTYKFHLSTANGQIKLSVDYPLSEGDYRVLYSDNTGNNENTSNYIRKNTGEDAKDDIVSFYVKADAEPTFTIERCSGFEGNTPTWETAVAATGISVAKDSVYNFTFTQPAGGLTISKTAQGYYSGNYYVRTDGAAGGWANYLSNPDNIMKHTEKASAEAAGYNYYYLRWIGDANGNSTTNVKYCVATDYNDCVSQEFGNDPADGSLSGGQALTGKGANVRFTYHAGTNNMTRTYVGGSGHDNQYLVVNGTNLKKSDGTEWSGRTKMTDLNDWIYTFELKAKDGATISLESHYNDKYVTILPSETVLEVNNDDYYGLRIVYDYKTNEIVAAYIPSTVDDVLDVDVDIMFIRKALDNKPDAVAPTTTLTLTGSGKITGEPKTLYGAIEFEKDFVRAEGLYSGLSANRPERSTYWISFPFDVQVKDIFGLGEYTDTWILQRYRGDLRASKGWFLDTKTFWEYILDKDYVLQAGQGYVLSLDCEAIQWPHNQTTQYLYFPSKDKITDITSVLPSASMDVPEHICSITSPADRTIKDAHWNVIGVPGFNDAWGRATETVTVSGGDLRYFYTWDSETNTLSTTSARNYEFKFMHSYMVQYYGNIDWSASEPALAPARRSADAKPEVVEFRIDIKQGDVKKDNTFVTLMDNDKITNGFDMNADLVKMYNANQANIYTIINDVEVSANCLPMTDQTTIVPVGVKIVANGDYTFSIPEGTEGIGVTLIDNETGIRTSLSALDYTINLSAGTYDNRFVLEISPVAQMPTDIENTDASVHDGIRKVMIDGILYIVRGNKIFDAQGKRVK